MTTRRTTTHAIGGKHGAKCTELLTLLNDYVDGKVDPAVCTEMEAHLAKCNPCKVVVDNVRKTITLYRDDGPCELPLKFRASLHAALRKCWKDKGMRKTAEGV
jgi:anti-sigma factor RsiW